MSNKYNFTYTRADFVLLLIVHSVSGHLRHSATSEMETLVDTQGRLIDDITKFIYKEYEKLNALEHYVMLLKRDRKTALENVKTYLDNPINALTLIKRLTVDLELLESQMQNSPDFERSEAEYPRMNDLSGAVMGLERLRSTYLLNISQIANGRLKGSKSDTMSVDDCFEVASILFDNKHYNGSIDWLAQALLKYSLGEPVYPTTLEDILKTLARSYEKLGDVNNTKLWKDRMATWNKFQIQRYNKMAEDLLKGSPRFSSTDRTYQNWLCRGITNVSREVLSKLKCFYITHNNPFLKLAPFKFEQLYIDPDINMVHDVINDCEINHFVDRAKAKMNMTYTKKEYTSSREARIAWFNHMESDIMRRVSKRMEDFSGLDLRSAEKLQVANYGIGGHYAQHIDYHTGEPGNKFATILIYISNVTSGGATVFDKLGVSVPVKKGAALMWRNLLPTGESNSRTTHAACPVLVGNKWVLKRWVNEIGQEFSSPCTNDQVK